ncbi:hypothetical protein [Bacillus sp. UNC41MFS5]|uniref:hypothetical protein n=1 Tax=Bacillus sp. UNC41MFS5 TaxID=1449046 RepID=UPI001E3F29BE|nr:hypothetical protein [Bacillus sp. UNC41MFS5]
MVLDHSHRCDLIRTVPLYVLLYSATYVPADKPPFVPEDVYWFGHEHQWRNIANGRINDGLKSFKLQVNVSDQLNVNSELASVSKRKDRHLNGKYSEIKRISLTLVGKFNG